MEWWVWVVAGLSCGVFEVLTPGAFVFIFFGVASLMVGAATAVGAVREFWQQSVMLVALALGSMVLFRRRLLGLVTPRTGRAAIDSMVGEMANAVEALPVGAIGKVAFRGSSWSARNVGDVAIAAGQRCRVEGSQELTLQVCAE